MKARSRSLAARTLRRLLYTHAPTPAAASMANTSSTAIHIQCRPSPAHPDRKSLARAPATLVSSVTADNN